MISLEALLSLKDSALAFIINKAEWFVYGSIAIYAIAVLFVFRRIIKGEGFRSTHITTKKDVIWIVLFAVCVRLFYWIFSCVIFYRNNEVLPTFMQVLNENKKTTDAGSYIHIVEEWYFYMEKGKNLMLVFFPLYPILARFLNFFIKNSLVSLNIVSLLTYIVGCVYLFKLVLLDFERKTAVFVLLFISISPFSFFFGNALTESLMILTSCASLYYIRLHKWHIAAVWGFFACMTRLIGCGVVLAGFVEILIYYKPFKMLKHKKYRAFWGVVLKKCTWLIPMCFGFLYYLFLNWQISGDAFKFLEYQKTHWTNSFTPMWNGVLGMFGHIRHQSFNENFRLYNAGIGILVYFIASLLLVVSLFRKHPTLLICYYVFFVFISFSQDFLISAGRYMVTCVPMFIALADLCNKKIVSAVVVSLLLLGGFVFVYSGFLNGMQIY